MKNYTCQAVYFIALGVLSAVFPTFSSASGQDACNPAPPAGLKKGDLYYVAFITRNQRDAADNDINPDFLPVPLNRLFLRENTTICGRSGRFWRRVTF